MSFHHLSSVYFVWFIINIQSKEHHFLNDNAISISRLLINKQSVIIVQFSRFGYNEMGWY